jgi:hypothetical protein
MSTFADIGCHVVSAKDPHGRILDLLDRSRYFFIHVSPQFYSPEWTPFQTCYFSENLAVQEIEPRPLDLQPGTLIITPQRRLRKNLLFFFNIQQQKSVRSESAVTVACHVPANVMIPVGLEKKN